MLCEKDVSIEKLYSMTKRNFSSIFRYNQSMVVKDSLLLLKGFRLLPFFVQNRRTELDFNKFLTRIFLWGYVRLLCTGKRQQPF